MSKQKFKSICWIFPVKTQMQINLFDFTCQNTKLTYSVIFSVIQNEFSMNLGLDKRNQSGQHLQVTFYIFFKSKFLSDMKSIKLILILCYDR